MLNWVQRFTHHFVNYYLYLFRWLLKTTSPHILQPIQNSLFLIRSNSQNTHTHTIIHLLRNGKGDEIEICDDNANSQFIHATYIDTVRTYRKKNVTTKKKPQSKTIPKKGDPIWNCQLSGRKMWVNLATLMDFYWQDHKPNTKNIVHQRSNLLFS